MLGRPEWRRILAVSALEAAVVLAVFGWMFEEHGLAVARTVAFTTLVFSELLRALAARSPTRLFWEVGTLSNLHLIAVIAGSILLQLGLLHVAPARALFDLADVGIRGWGIALAMALVPVSAWELTKLVTRAIRAPAA
jgi:Ca2+-transporting ATPase